MTHRHGMSGSSSRTESRGSSDPASGPIAPPSYRSASQSSWPVEPAEPAVVVDVDGHGARVDPAVAVPVDVRLRRTGRRPLLPVRIPVDGPEGAGQRAESVCFRQCCLVEVAGGRLRVGPVHAAVGNGQSGSAEGVVHDAQVVRLVVVGVAAAVRKAQVVSEFVDEGGRPAAALRQELAAGTEGGAAQPRDVRPPHVAEHPAAAGEHVLGFVLPHSRRARHLGVAGDLGAAAAQVVRTPDRTPAVEVRGDAGRAVRVVHGCFGVRRDDLVVHAARGELPGGEVRLDEQVLVPGIRAVRRQVDVDHAVAVGVEAGLLPPVQEPVTVEVAARVQCGGIGRHGRLSGDRPGDGGRGCAQDADDEGASDEGAECGSAASGTIAAMECMEHASTLAVLVYRTLCTVASHDAS